MGWKPDAVSSSIKGLPGAPPVGTGGADLAITDRLDAGLFAVLIEGIGLGELHNQLRGAAGVVGLDRLQVPERLFCSRLDHFARTLRRHLPRRVAGDALFDGDRGQAVAKQVARLVAGGLVAGDEQHRTAPGATERSVDTGLTHQPSVEPEVLPGLS